MRDRKVIVLGAGGHAVSVAEAVTAAGYSLTAFVSARDAGRVLLGIAVLDAIPSEHIRDGGAVVLAVGDNYSREQEWQRLTAVVPEEQLPAVAHPSASVSRFASVAAGSVIMQGAVVGSGASIGIGCLLNSAAVLEHECEMGPFSSLGPSATTGGRVRIGTRTALSIGSVVKHGVVIGDDTVIGAASYVHTDVPPRVVAYGTPARVIRTRDPDESYLA